MTTPNVMPKKSNAIGAQIVTALIDTKPTSWVHKAIDAVATADPKKPVIIETKREGRELRHPLAQNVSGANVERAARKFLQ